MKHKHISTSARIAGALALVLLAAGAILFAKQHATGSAIAPAAAAAPIATITSSPAFRGAVPLTVTAWGDVAPSQSDSLSLPRAGQLVMLAVVVGQRVSKGAVMARIAADPVTEAGYLTARNTFTLARGESRRLQALFALQLATVSQVETAKKAVNDAQATLDAQRKTGAGAGDVAITAPFDGVVTALSAMRGDRLAANAPVLQLGRVDTLRIQLGIEPSEHTRVHLGDVASLRPLQLRSEAYGSAASRAVQGRITDLQYLVDPKTQLVSATVQVPAAASAGLVPGMRVEASIAVGRAEGWLVPRLAVLTDSQGDYIYQVKDETAHRVRVQQLAQAQGEVAVEGAIDTALPLVTAGNYELTDGMKVREASK